MKKPKPRRITLPVYVSVDDALGAMAAAAGPAEAEVAEAALRRREDEERVLPAAAGPPAVEAEAAVASSLG